ncbi:related to Streptococcus M protein [Phialocephala subalpina]|uniref:Related to Streptococcus M protein n=1 Tax=Phialocephala subalpina TaxID=576137 RepID=A0A1L7XWM0_9HELO|nr:related to Streptococcus M protein [Phialocephala subalpina]
MPKQKAPKGPSASSEVNDPRFSNFTTDPRFRLPSKKHTKTKLDSRFSRMLKDDDFSKSTTVDRYGRKLKSDSKKKALERLYVPEDEEEEADVEVEDDDVVERELQKAEGYDPARGGGFSSSEDEDEDEEDGGVEIEEVEEEFPDMQAESAAVEMGEVSSRFAVVNLDWDHIRSVDLMAVFSSFVRPGGKIHKISIYPSEFGKERMEREELEGPPKEIFSRKAEEEEEEEEKDSEDESEDEEELEEKIKKDLQKADDGQEFDGAALRQYQLERLRYYYAVVVCSDNDTAQKIYEATDGTEYLSSANFFDLRFIPDGTDFDDKPRDECESTPAGYRPTEFVTDALQHSKVKLTWDTNPEDAVRKDAINRAFSGSRAEIGENDLRAYLGSDSDGDEEEEALEAPEADTPKLSKKELARQKMRAALGLADEPAKPSKKSSSPVRDMEITFTGGLTSTEKGNVFENDPALALETTAERYIRLEKERKARRKERAKAKREGRDPDAVAEEADEPGEKEDLGFDDPFFATDEAVKEKASKSLRKEDRLKKKAAKAAEAAEKESHRAELELLMADNGTEPSANIDHFDINEIARAEKAKKKKGKKAKEIETGKRGGLQEGFEMDVGDNRFSKLFESHEFAIDPSNPKFKGTEGMKKLLEEGRKKRKVDGDDDGVEEKKSKKRKDEGELSGLVQKLKKKSKR